MRVCHVCLAVTLLVSFLHTVELNARALNGDQFGRLLFNFYKCRS